MNRIASSSSLSVIPPEDPGESAQKRVATLSPADREILERLLDSWILRDLQDVVDVVDRRLAAAELIERLSGDPRVHESALHELISRSLWMFGIEYEDSEFWSNATLRTIVRRLFGNSGGRLLNARQRPDIVVVPGDSTYCLANLRPRTSPLSVAIPRPAMVVVELKRGGSRLARKDMSQIDGYAQELADACMLNSVGFIHAWVVGDDIAAGVPTDRLLCNAERCYARVRATTFSALGEAARRQFPNSFSAIRPRYLSMSTEGLFARSAR